MPQATRLEVIDARQRRTVRDLEEFLQAILRDSERVRKALPIWTKLKPGAEWEVVQKQARTDFWENVIGKLPGKYAALNPRTRLIARACGTGATLSLDLLGRFQCVGG
ncbi:MAG: hypothetical protein NTV08_06550 [Verrucomicrobia bacterium]|nr:hypothetical protein [Verrucomicrobiota bacterium]